MNYLFRQCRTRNITKVILITHIKRQHYNVRAKEIAQIAGIQPPVTFEKLSQKNYRLK